MNKIRYRLNDEQAWAIHEACTFNNYLEDAESWCEDNDVDIQTPQMYAMMAEYVKYKFDSNIEYWDNFYRAYEANESYCEEFPLDVTMDDVRKKFVFEDDPQVIDVIDMNGDGKDHSYSILIEEKYRRVVTVTAASPDEAVESATTDYNNGEIEMDSNAFEGVDFVVIGKEE